MSERRTPLQRVLVLVGGGALLAAMAIDGIAVVGRHVRLPLLGSIEAVQAAVLVAGTVALLVATIANRHARVHLLVDRCPAVLVRALRALGATLGAALFLALAAGSAWIALDLWTGHEESEWLHIPYAPLRILTVASALAVAAAFAAALLRRERR
jgi:TRAP-type C4-dicarboxylate transport system permease small subunit